MYQFTRLAQTASFGAKYALSGFEACRFTNGGTGPIISNFSTRFWSAGLPRKVFENIKALKRKYPQS